MFPCISCVTLFGSVEDQNGDLDRVSVAIDGSAIEGVILNAARDSWTLSDSARCKARAKNTN
jgi:hypothetical protein